MPRIIHSQRHPVELESADEGDFNETSMDTIMADYAGGQFADEDADDQVDDVIKQISKNLVRYSLACDYQRIPMRRTAFREKFMTEHPRAWKKAFDLAQKKLRTVFGMELRELPVREKLTMDEKRKATSNSNPNPKSSDSYILVTIIPPQFRTASLIPPSSVPTLEDEAAFVAFYTLVITFIVLHGGEISDPRLRRYLQRTDPEMGNQKLNDMLARCERVGYIAKRVQKNAYSAGDDDQDTSYLVGPRGKVEVKNENVAGFIREAYGDAVDDELERQIEHSLGVEAKKGWKNQTQTPRPTQTQAEEEEEEEEEEEDE